MRPFEAALARIEQQIRNEGRMMAREKEDEEGGGNERVQDEEPEMDEVDLNN